MKPSLAPNCPDEYDCTISSGLWAGDAHQIRPLLGLTEEFFGESLIDGVHAELRSNLRSHNTWTVRTINAPRLSDAERELMTQAWREKVLCPNTPPGMDANQIHLDFLTQDQSDLLRIAGGLCEEINRIFGYDTRKAELEIGNNKYEYARQGRDGYFHYTGLTITTPEGVVSFHVPGNFLNLSQVKADADITSRPYRWSAEHVGSTAKIARAALFQLQRYSEGSASEHERIKWAKERYEVIFDRWAATLFRK